MSQKRCSLGPTVSQQDKALTRLKRRVAIGKTSSGKAKVLSAKLDYRFSAPRDRRVHAEIRYDFGVAKGSFSSFEAAIPWLKEHGVQTSVCACPCIDATDCANARYSPIGRPDPEIEPCDCCCHEQEDN